MRMDALVTEQGIKEIFRRFKKRELTEKGKLGCGNKHLRTQGCKASYTSAWFRASSEERVLFSARVWNVHGVHSAPLLVPERQNFPSGYQWYIC